VLFNEGVYSKHKFCGYTGAGVGGGKQSEQVSNGPVDITAKLLI